MLALLSPDVELWSLALGVVLPHLRGVAAPDSCMENWQGACKTSSSGRLQQAAQQARFAGFPSCKHDSSFSCIVPNWVGPEKRQTNSSTSSMFLFGFSCSRRGWELWRAMLLVVRCTRSGSSKGAVRVDTGCTLRHVKEPTSWQLRLGSDHFRGYSQNAYAS